MAILAQCPICRKKQSNKNRLCSCGEDLTRARRSERVKYWICYHLPNGKKRTEFVGKKFSDAQAADGKRRGQKREGRIFDIKPDTRMTFNELSGWYLNLEKIKALASYPIIKITLRKFNQEFGETIVGRIRPADLENYQAKRKAMGKADNTVDHEIGKAKTMVLKAFDNDLISADTLKTFKRVKKLLKKGSDIRDRILSFEEFSLMLENAPRHIRHILTFGYYTGMRKGEILSLKWENIDLKKRMITIDARNTKDKESRKIPICDELLKTIRVIPRAIHNDHVILFEGKPIRDVRDGLKTACAGAGVSYGRFMRGGFIFHDLRHTFNTNMRKSGVQESVIMAITGHSTREMFDRYNRIDEDDTREAVKRMERFIRPSEKEEGSSNMKEIASPITSLLIHPRHE